MQLFGSNFRKWWQFPRPTGDRSAHRTVTFLELFYDLIYVVVIAQLAHHLAGHIDQEGFLGYLFLFFIVWWSWFNGMSYHDLHGNNDIRTRVFTFLQMICVAGMAIFSHDALGETARHFSVAYGLFQLTLWYLWWRVGVHDPVHRVLSRPYSTVFLIATVLFLAAAFVPDGVRGYLWGASVVISLILPLFAFGIGRNNPVAQTEIDKMIIVSPSMVERFGLFTIIVLGEVVVGAVNGLIKHHHYSFHAISLGVLGILVAVGLWWVYFDSVSHRTPYTNTMSVTSWMYLHLPLTASIAAVGAAILNVVGHADDPISGNVRWLLVGSVALAQLSVVLLINVVDSGSEAHAAIHRRSRNALLLAAIATAIVGLLPLSAHLTLGLIVLFLLAPIYFALSEWLQRFDEVDIDTDH